MQFSRFVAGWCFRMSMENQSEDTKMSEVQGSKAVVDQGDRAVEQRLKALRVRLEQAKNRVKDIEEAIALLEADPKSSAKMLKALSV